MPECAGSLAATNWSSNVSKNVKMDVRYTKAVSSEAEIRDLKIERSALC